MLKELKALIAYLCQASLDSDLTSSVCNPEGCRKCADHWGKRNLSLDQFVRGFDHLQLEHIQLSWLSFIILYFSCIVYFWYFCHFFPFFFLYCWMNLCVMFIASQYFFILVSLSRICQDTYNIGLFLCVVQVWSFLLVRWKFSGSQRGLTTLEMPTETSLLWCTLICR